MAYSNDSAPVLRGGKWRYPSCAKVGCIFVDMERMQAQAGEEEAFAESDRLIEEQCKKCDSNIMPECPLIFEDQELID